MHTCKRCGYNISSDQIICPGCGSVSEQIGPKEARKYEIGSEDQNSSPIYNEGYQQRQPHQESVVNGYSPPSIHPAPPPIYPLGGVPTPPPSYIPIGQMYNIRQPLMIPPAVNVQFFQQPSTPGVTPLIVEILCSLCGVFGIGWLIANKILPGLLLLLGSFMLYWPLAIVLVVATDGLGIFLVGPLSIVAIILNAVLLNKQLQQQRARQFFMAQPIYTHQMPQMPPPQMPLPPQF